MTDWLPEHDAMLRKHLRNSFTAQGTAAAINDEFGTVYSRNSVISRARRIKVPLTSRCVHRGGRVAGPQKPKPERASTPAQRPDIAIRKAASEPKPAPFVPRVVGANPQNVTLLELAPDGCKWPTAETTVHLFCNHRRLTNLPYCAPHQRIARA